MNPAETELCANCGDPYSIHVFEANRRRCVKGLPRASMMAFKRKEQENTPHDHGPLKHVHFHRPGDGHDHKPRPR